MAIPEKTNPKEKIPKIEDLIPEEARLILGYFASLLPVPGTATPVAAPAPKVEEEGFLDKHAGKVGLVAGAVIGAGCAWALNQNSDSYQGSVSASGQAALRSSL